MSLFRTCTLLALFTLLSITTAKTDPRVHKLVARAQTNNDFLSADKIALLKFRLAKNSSDSWVSGTRTEALIEFVYPQLAVFAENYTKVFKTPRPIPRVTNEIVEGWQQVHNTSEFIHQDGGAATDPFSIGNAFILASVTDPRSAKRKNYTRSIKQANQYLWNQVPRAEDGTISTRPSPEPLQYWADEIYMLPPYLAYHGVFSKNITEVREAYRQIKLYRNILNSPQRMLFTHIQQGSWNDVAIWGTGNAWAAAGMLRVAATIYHSEYSVKLLKETAELLIWAHEIVSTAFRHVDPKTNILPNEYFAPNGTFSDSSSSALLTAVAYQLNNLGFPQANRLMPIANRIRRQLYKNVTPEGWVSPAVNPFQWYVESGKSPESTAFMLILEAAWKKHQAAQVKRAMSTQAALDRNGDLLRMIASIST